MALERKSQFVSRTGLKHR